MEFLYFPDDKSEYIPAIIELLIFMILASVVMYFIYKQSKKAARHVDQQYSQKNIDENKNNK